MRASSGPWGGEPLIRRSPKGGSLSRWGGSLGAHEALRRGRVPGVPGGRGNRLGYMMGKDAGRRVLSQRELWDTFWSEEHPSRSRPGAGEGQEDIPKVPRRGWGAVGTLLKLSADRGGAVA